MLQSASVPPSLSLEDDGHAVEGLGEDLRASTGAALVEDLHASTAAAKHLAQDRLLRNVVVRERAAVLELLARKDETLLVGRMPSWSCISRLTMAMLSEDCTSRVMVMPLRVLTKICERSTRCSRQLRSFPQITQLQP